ncbi:MAG: PfkB family carbohydrate kinase [Chthonomonadales bacterium]
MGVVTLGEALIDFVALEAGVGVGEATGFLKAPGGAPANVAAGVARLGRPAAFLGKVGDDPFGRFLRDTLANAGVDVGGLRLDTNARTGLAFVSLTASGERDFCFFRNPSADMLYRPDEVDEARIRRGRILHFGSITLIQEPSRAATLHAVDVARQAGLLVTFDPNLRPPLWPSLEEARRVILDALPSAHVIKVSEEELHFLTGNPDPSSSMDDLLAALPGVGMIVTTLGARGAMWKTRRSGGEAGAPAVTPIDTTGAGDGFVAGLLVNMLDARVTPQHLQDLDAARIGPMMRFACAVGALTTTKKGAIPALPTMEQVEKVLEMGGC